MAHAEAHHAEGHHSEGHAGPHHGPDHYVKIWGILCVLLVVSIVGPMLGHKLVTLIAAFGIAIVKAWMVASYFMHLNIEKKYVSMLLITMIGALMVFWYGISADVQKHEGTNWENRASEEHIRQQLEYQKAHPAGHGGDEGAAPADGEHH